MSVKDTIERLTGKELNSKTINVCGIDIQSLSFKEDFPKTTLKEIVSSEEYQNNLDKVIDDVIYLVNTTE